MSLLERINTARDQAVAAEVKRCEDHIMNLASVDHSLESFDVPAPNVHASIATKVATKLTADQIVCVYVPAGKVVGQAYYQVKIVPKPAEQPQPVAV